MMWMVCDSFSKRLPIVCLPMRKINNPCRIVCKTDQRQRNPHTCHYTMFGIPHYVDIPNPKLWNVKCCWYIYCVCILCHRMVNSTVNKYLNYICRRCPMKSAKDCDKINLRIHFYGLITWKFEHRVTSNTVVTILYSNLQTSTKQQEKYFFLFRCLKSQQNDTVSRTLNKLC